VIPVNYVLHDGAVWIRSTPYSMLARETAGGQMAFEVDGVDEFTRSGWSVLVRGRAERRSPAELPRDLRRWRPGPRVRVRSCSRSICAR
jgi:nitroimidazol reductase NimA-like FMN-containing flavoprotein (pyridoxamine 5'-phosphate oxidase superfamily)